MKWCHQAHIDPFTCTVSDVLSFLQYRLDSGSLPSTLKVYVAAIAAFRSPQGGQSIGRNAMVVSFLKGARRLSGFATVRTLLLLFCALLPIFVLFSDLSKIFTSADQHSAQTTQFLEKEDFLPPTASSLHSGDR